MDIPGTIVFTGEQSRRGYRLNRMAMSLTDAANRQHFVADEAGYARRMGLTDDEVGMVCRRDWRAMLEHGASIYLIIKVAGALGVSLPQVGAHTGGGGDRPMARIVGGIGSSHAPSMGARVGQRIAEGPAMGAGIRRLCAGAALAGGAAPGFVGDILQRSHEQVLLRCVSDVCAGCRGGAFAGR